ncbi:DNA methyltransferase [Magnetospirillum sp. SS-4]|uniref:class I SAM-dependent DNA methyltransferase n=1 Tax=Magnetospirillum sp. SS-4 TaxID=2681465 RepID=UPI00137E8F16|nr:DNA methyltransferase [Magnetospirillum sp. SS-4]CAA7619076.1 Methylase [Magnetospirillum sp. SS-4]
MRLSWNEIRARAAAFAADWADEGYEKGQTQLFYRDFFEVFGMSVRRVASFEEPVKNLGDKRGFIDLFWKGVLLVEQKSVGRDLKKAKTQALDYFPGLKDTDLPRYILLSDFQTFELYDLEEGDELFFALADLPRHVEKFGFILGVQKRSFKDQDPVNIAASELVGKLHDALEDAGYTGHDLEQFLVRTVFCLFADDTGIFEPRDIFLDLLENRTREDGSDMGGWLAQLFQVLNTPEDRRPKNLDADLARFPYVNGDLFRDPLLIPSFDAGMRQRLIEACRFDWSGISPAIFGSLFQSVMNKKERRAKGAHYTTEKNILKVIEPLFLSELRAEFERLKARRDSRRRPDLLKFQEKLGQLRFFDPACGCGNFLIIAYRELRALEIEVMKEVFNTGQLDALAQSLSVIDVDQFYGIEIGEFPARIAETALWMMDHIMNNRLSLEFGQTYVRIPLKKSPHILHGDALETEWAALLPPEECSFVFGNPPFVGAKYQSDRQRNQVRRIAALGKTGGTLDYVTAWFIKAGEYVRNSNARIGFVSTNSITQGEQVAQLWPILFDRCKLEIAFAHRTFAWGSDARGKAHVHVVIIGLAKRDAAPKDRLLFSYDDINGEPLESTHAALSPYLFDASALSDVHLVVREAMRALNGFPPLLSGSQPIDDGNYIFDVDQRTAFLAEEPGAAKFLRPYVGSREHINGGKRWILMLQNASPGDLKGLPKVLERMRAVKGFRAKSPRKSTLAIASFPEKYNVEVIPTVPFLVVPEASSERREYVPIGWLEPPTIPSNLVRIIENASKPLFGLLTSAMHMSWLRHIGGRLKSDYRYSIGLVYNTFPLPPVSEAGLAKLEPLAQAVLDARAAHPGAILADLYDPDTMPTALRKAHQALDRAVDRLYRKQGFTSDRERVEHLLGLYENMTAPINAAAKIKAGRRRAKRPTA